MATRKNRGTRKGGAWRNSHGRWKKVSSPKLQSYHAQLQTMGQFTRKSASSPKLQSYHAEIQTMAPMGQFTRKSGSPQSRMSSSPRRALSPIRKNGYYRGLANNWVRSASYKKHRNYS
jgi:hypothetical protein